VSPLPFIFTLLLPCLLFRSMLTQSKVFSNCSHSPTLFIIQHFVWLHTDFANFRTSHLCSQHGKGGLISFFLTICDHSSPSLTSFSSSFVVDMNFCLFLQLFQCSPQLISIFRNFRQFAIVFHFPILVHLTFFFHRSSQFVCSAAAAVFYHTWSPCVTDKTRLSMESLGPTALQQHLISPYFPSDLSV